MIAAAIIQTAQTAQRGCLTEPPCNWSTQDFAITTIMPPAVLWAVAWDSAMVVPLVDTESSSKSTAWRAGLAASSFASERSSDDESVSLTPITCLCVPVPAVRVFSRSIGRSLCNPAPRTAALIGVWPAERRR